MSNNLGERINCDVLGSQRAEYGKQIVATLLRQLQEEYGERRFDEKNIRRMMQFASVYMLINPSFREDWVKMT